MPVRHLYAAAVAVSLLGGAAQADDPPLRVGRISDIEGTVSFHPADAQAWSYATLNYPVVSGNAFWTDTDGRSEVQIGSVEIRMDNSTEMEVTRLDETATQIEVPQGTVNIHFSTPPLNGSVEVLTPSGPIELTQPGTYHIDSGAAGSGAAVQVTALEGQLEIRSPRAVLEVMQGETAVLTGNPPTFSLQEANPTPFDDWALARERREEAHMSAQYVSPHTTGYEDLDYYGQWTADPTYGQVWYPTTVQADWAPYRYGHWAYIAPWGWTWVDNAPWGFAPFHYGRWAMLGNRWCWVPGEVVERPVYAPALVAFIGGPGWSISLSVGGAAPAVGWVPLAPSEVFYPYYPASVNYVRNVNITNVNRTVINNINVNNIHNVNITNYANRGASTVVTASAFQSGQSVHKSRVQVSGEQLAHAPVTPTLAHLTPAPAAREEGRPMPSQAQAPYTRQMEPRPSGAMHETTSPAPTMPQQPTPQQHAQPYEAQQHEAPNPARQPAHAPAPPRHAPLQQQAMHMPPPSQPLPHAQVPHPEQHTQVRATPQGWKRMPAGQPPHPPEKGQSHEERRQE